MYPFQKQFIINKKGEGMRLLVADDEKELVNALSVVWVYISTLRKRLAAVGGGVEIRAARGLGYTLEERT